jgi:hypothetical protein
MRYLKWFVALFVVMYSVSFAHAESESLQQLKLTCFAQTRFDAEIGEGATGDTELLANQFKVNRVRIRATGKLVKTLGFFVQMDAGSNPALKDARLRVGCPAFPITFEAGRFLLPFGIEAPINPYWLPAVDYSLPVSKMMAGFWDVGAKVFGKIPVNEQVALSYVAAVVNGNTGGYTDTDKNKDFVGRLGISLPMGLSLGGSAYIGKVVAVKEGLEDDVPKNRFGGDIKLANGPALLQAEALLGKNDETDSMGFYALGAFKVLPKVQLVGKFAFYDPDTDEDDDQTTRVQAGANCFIAGNNQLQVFYQFSNNPDDTTSHNIIAQLALMFETD